MNGLAAGVRRALAGAGAVVVAGCASLSTAPPPDRVHAGRFAATATLDSRSENTTGRFTLEVHGERLALDLGTPLGNTLARIELGPDGALMRTTASDGSVQEARGRDGEALAEQLLGWPLPVAGIADWIVGRPAPGRPATVERDGERIAAIEQDGWTIRIDERFERGAPRRLTFTRPARNRPPAPAISLRLVLDADAASSS